MTKAVVVAQTGSVPTLVAEMAEKAAGYAEAAKASNTRRAYRSDWQVFETWCAGKGVIAMPAAADTVLAYLIDHAGQLKVATLSRRLSAIREAHLYAGHPLDTSGVAFRDVWRGIRRTHAAPQVQKAPLLTAQLRRTVGTLPDTNAGRRDRALLLVGFGAALRRSELAALEVCSNGGASWIEETPDGLTIHLGASKTDQEGEGDLIGVPYGANVETCPVRAYKAWLTVSGITSGPAFRAIDRHGNMSDEALTDKAVARIVKRSIIAAETLNGATMEEAKTAAARFAGHSLRSGLATSASANDAPGQAIQRQLRHKKFDTTMKYIRVGQLYKKNAAGMAGL